MNSHQFVYPNFTNFEDQRLRYIDMVKWIEVVVMKQEHGASWSKVSDCIYITIEDEDDAMLFALKFGQGQTYESI